MAATPMSIIRVDFDDAANTAVFVMEALDEPPVPPGARPDNWYPQGRMQIISVPIPMRKATTKPAVGVYFTVENGAMLWWRVTYSNGAWSAPVSIPAP